MRKTLLFCASAFAMLTAAPVMAAVTPVQAQIVSDADAADYFKDFQLTPAPGEIQALKLNQLTLSFPNLGDAFITEEAYDLADVITLSDGAGTTIHPSQAYRNDDRKSVFIQFSSDDLSGLNSGVYTLKVEAGALGILDVDGVASPEMTAQYTVKGADNYLASLVWSSGSIYDCVQQKYYYDYEDRSNMNNISIVTAKIDKPADMPAEIWLSYVDGYKINKSALKDVKITNGALTVIPESAEDNGYIYVKMYLAEPLTLEGSYSMTIPDGLVTFGNGEKSLGGQVNDMFAIGDGTGISYNFNSYLISPEPGKTVNNITKVTISFPNAVDLATDQELEYNEIFSPHHITLTLDDGNEDDPIVYMAKSVSTTGCFVDIEFDEGQLDDGRYELSVPPGYWRNPEYHDIINPAILANFIVNRDYSSVEGVAVETETYTVTDLAGRTVLLNADKAALSTLDAGLYVINGKKVAVRK